MNNYECFAIKAIGFSHVEKNMVCQDSAQCVCNDNSVIIAVADGHGSSQYFRSDRGSRFAVECALSSLEEFCKKISIDKMDSEPKTVIKQLSNSIITSWNKRIEDDLLNYEFGQAEIINVPDEYKELYFSGKKLERAYGTTLICAVLTAEYTVGLQIGDGKCVAMSSDGSMYEPIPWDERCHLNRCTSLCDEKASEEFRFYIWRDNPPVALLLCSDGIDDTFGNFLHKYFRSVLLELSDGDFYQKVIELQESLPSLSQNGSKDDVSLSGIINTDEIKKIRDLIQTDIELNDFEERIIVLKNKINDQAFIKNKAERIFKKSQECSDENIIHEKQYKLEDASRKYIELSEQLKELESNYEHLKLKRKNMVFNGSGECVCPRCGQTLQIEYRISDNSEKSGAKNEK